MKDAPSALALFLLVTSLAASARSTSGGLRGELKYRASSVPDQHSYLLAMPADQRAPLPAALVLSSGALVVAYRGVVEVFPKYDEHLSKRRAELPFQEDSGGRRMQLRSWPTTACSCFPERRGGCLRLIQR